MCSECRDLSALCDRGNDEFHCGKVGLPIELQLPSCAVAAGTVPSLASSSTPQFSGAATAADSTQRASQQAKRRTRLTTKHQVPLSTWWCQYDNLFPFHVTLPAAPIIISPLPPPQVNNITTRRTPWPSGGLCCPADGAAAEFASAFLTMSIFALNNTIVSM